MTQDAWDPALYERFKSQRRQPFDDLVKLIQLEPGKRIIDLGCGTGELTRELHDRFHATTTLGVDTSGNMLAKAAAFAGPGLTFQQRNIANLSDDEPYDLVFSNAALHWIPNHVALFGRLTKLVADEGQLAVQLPAMEHSIPHRLAAEIAQRPRFREVLAGFIHQIEALPVERYAQLLFELGYREQHVRLQVYPHVLPGREDVVTWVSGTLLTDYERRLPSDLFAAFVDEYRAELMTRLSPSRPFFFGFRRILLWGRR